MLGGCQPVTQVAGLHTEEIFACMALSDLGMTGRCTINSLLKGHASNTKLMNTNTMTDMPFSINCQQSSCFFISAQLLIYGSGDLQFMMSNVVSSASECLLPH